MEERLRAELHSLSFEKEVLHFVFFAPFLEFNDQVMGLPKPCLHYTILGVLDVATHPHPNWGESLICLVTVPKYLKDSSYDLVQHRATDSKLDINPAGYPEGA